MKNVTALLFLSLLSSHVFASTTDSHFIELDNSDKVDSFTLSAIATRTEYRTETISTTCYRQVFDGYRTVCDNFFTKVNSPVDVVALVGPHPAPEHPTDPRDPPPESKPGRDEPRDPGAGREEPTEPREPREPSRTCHQEATYRDEAYSCLQSVSVPYEVYDHNALASVKVKISGSQLSSPVDTHCGINFSLTGDSFRSNNNCSNVVAMADIASKTQGVHQDLNYSIRLFDAQKVLAPLAGGLRNMRVDGDNLIVKTGDLLAGANFSIKLFVQRNRFLKKDTVLINRALKTKEYTYTAIDEKTGNLKINLDDLLGGFESGKKHTIAIKLVVKLPDGTLIPNDSIPSLTQEESITIH